MHVERTFQNDPISSENELSCISKEFMVYITITGKNERYNFEKYNYLLKIIEKF